MINIRKLLGLPTKANELTYWGCIHLKRKRYKQALSWFTRAHELDPNNDHIKDKIAEAIYFDIRSQLKCKK